MTSKPDSVSTLGYHWTGHTGRPLDPQVHWDATGTTLADASTQWCSSGNPVLICIIGTHWKTTGKPLEDHWKTTRSTLAFLQWHSSVHWGLSSRHTGLPLEDHWLRVRDMTSMGWCGIKLLIHAPTSIAVKLTGWHITTHWFTWIKFLQIPELWQARYWQQSLPWVALTIDNSTYFLIGHATLFTMDDRVPWNPETFQELTL